MVFRIFTSHAIFRVWINLGPIAATAMACSHRLARSTALAPSTSASRYEKKRHGPPTLSQLKPPLRGLLLCMPFRLATTSGLSQRAQRVKFSPTTLPKVSPVNVAIDVCTNNEPEVISFEYARLRKNKCSILMVGYVLRMAPCASPLAFLAL